MNETVHTARLLAAQRERELVWACEATRRHSERRRASSPAPRPLALGVQFWQHVLHPRRSAVS